MEKVTLEIRAAEGGEDSKLLVEKYHGEFANLNFK